MRRTGLVALLLAGYGIIAFLYLLRLSWTVVPDSDNAAAALQAVDMLKGNWALYGWSLPADPYWLVELPLYAAAIAGQGFSLSVLHTVPALIYLCLLALVGVASAGPFVKTRRAAWCAAWLALLPLVFPARLLSAVSLVGPFHISTIVVVLAFLLMLDALYVRHRPIRVAPKVILTTAAFLICSAAIVGDPFAVWIGLLPLLIVSGLDGASLYYVKRASAGSVLQAFLPGLLGLGAWLLAAVTLWLVTAHGGFTMVPLNSLASAFVELHQVGRNLSLLTQDILGMTGADFFGGRANVLAIPIFVRLAGCVAAGFAVWVVFREWRRGGEVDWLSHILAVSCALLLLAFVMSQFSTVLGDTRSARYLVPVVVFGSVVAGRWAGRRAPLLPLGRTWIGAAMGALAVIYAFAPFVQVVTGPAPFPTRDLAEFLQRHGLHNGLGAYWDASIISVASAGAITVRPVISQQSRIVPYHWNSAQRWYSPETPFTFLVFDETNWGDVGWETAELTFGRPTSVYHLEKFTILVWPDGISVNEERAGR